MTWETVAAIATALFTIGAISVAVYKGLKTGLKELAGELVDDRSRHERTEQRIDSLEAKQKENENFLKRLEDKFDKMGERIIDIWKQISDKDE